MPFSYTVHTVVVSFYSPKPNKTPTNSCMSRMEPLQTGCLWLQMTEKDCWIFMTDLQLLQTDNASVKRLSLVQ